MVLILSYWIHMAATVVWIGGLFFQAAILPSAAAQNLSTSQQATLMESVRRRFNPLAGLSLVLLIVTGLVQMTANDNYVGLLATNNPWSISIFAKHMAIGLMVVLGIFQTWWLQPNLARSIMLQATSSADEGKMQSLISRNYFLTRINFLAALLVLFLTALARTA